MKAMSYAALLFSLAGAGCAAEVASARPDAETARAELLQTDREWAALVASGGSVEKILSYWTDDARVVAPGEEPVIGQDALRQMVASSFEIPGFSITWEPEEVHVSDSGDLGYTTGWNRMTFLSEQGEQVVQRHRYITVWRKEADGRWRCEYDMWNAPPAEKAAGA
jgi:ketosteroid isomerase-like protein